MKQDHKCPVCRVKLNEDNIAFKEDGTVRLDMNGKPWCNECTEEYDEIEWDK